MGTVASGIALGIERKRAESELRESEERVRLLLDSTGEGIYGIDLEGRCTFCNAAALRMLGYDDAAELLGQNMHALIQHTRGDGNPYPSRRAGSIRHSTMGAAPRPTTRPSGAAIGRPSPSSINRVRFCTTASGSGRSSLSRTSP